jgi:hypothetical protein
VGGGDTWSAALSVALARARALQLECNLLDLRCSTRLAKFTASEPHAHVPLQQDGSLLHCCCPQPPSAGLLPVMPLPTPVRSTLRRNERAGEMGLGGR